MSKLTKALTAAAGNAGGDNLYVEDVFSTYLYTPSTSNSNIPINNGIDLDGEGGMVWIKRRDASVYGAIVDTERGGQNVLHPSDNFAAYTANIVQSFNGDGFTTGTSSFVSVAASDTVSWTFRKAEKFFDVVTYTGDGVAGRTVAHNLGSVPACIIVKNISLSGYNWQVYHTSTGNTDYLNLNDTDATASFIGAWNNTSPTSTHFTLGNWAQTNDAAGSTYVAYLFASDAGGFGDDGSESIIKCGSVTADGIGNVAETNLGWEPQWVLYKRTDSTSPWYLFDTMRGLVTGSDPSSTDNFVLYPNLSNAETQSGSLFQPTATGFAARAAVANSSWIYIAIRRPMKTPESGTEVFAVDEANSSTNPNFYSGFPVDVSIRKYLTNSSQSPELETRLTNKKLETAQTAAENATDSGWWDWQDGVSSSGHGTGTFAWMFKRATGFFDVVAYTGDGTTQHQITHNLGVTPEIIIVKRRSAVDDWLVCHKDQPDLGDGTQYNGRLNSNSAFVYTASNPSVPYFGIPTTGLTSTYFTTGALADVNGTGSTYISYLFATLAGVSKVGSYTGTAADLNVDCGFSAGARFILIKRTDSTGDWYVWDSVRGIVAGDDPYLLINSTAAEVTSTDYIDPLASGFTVTSSAPAALNASGGTYIFLAIA